MKYEPKPEREKVREIKRKKIEGKLGGFKSRWDHQ